MTRVRLGDWTAPSGNNVIAYYRPIGAGLATLDTEWDEPPPLADARAVPSEAPPQGSLAPKLAAAAVRLRGKPGRPRASQARAPLADPPGTRLPDGPVPAVCPRLLDLEGAAGYLSVSPWTVRDLVAAGTLARVRIPRGRGELRKLLFDRQDLDRLVDAWSSG